MTEHYEKRQCLKKIAQAINMKLIPRIALITLMISYSSTHNNEKDIDVNRCKCLL